MEIIKERVLISFSGGRTSAYMTHWLLQNKKDDYEMIVVFSNTGKEREETLEFVRDCDNYLGFNTIWVEAIINQSKGKGTRAKIVNFETACRNGDVFESMIKKYGLPNQTSPICTRELKKAAIKSYARSIGWIGRSYKTALGIRKDEPKRLDFKKAKIDNIIYPLADLGIIKSDINYWWSKQNFDLNLKSYEGNCDLCWKKSRRKILSIIRDNPGFAEWWLRMERKYENYIPESRKENENIKLPLRMYRGNDSIEDLIEESVFPFDLSIDESKEFNTYRQMMLWNEYMDGNNGCVESCEPF